jgi:hypothetical protein
VLAKRAVVPAVAGDADDPAVELAAVLEPVERGERLLLRQVAGESEDHEDVAFDLDFPALRS